MKVILFLAISADGFIAKVNDEVTWSEDVWRNYFSFCGEIGNLMVGRRTYELMKSEGETEKLNLRNFLVISHFDKPVDASGLWFRSPEEAITSLEKRGERTLIQGGGRVLNQYLFSKGLIDEIQLDVEARLYGSGVQLFGDIGGEHELELLEVGKAGAHTARLHYRVKR